MKKLMWLFLGGTVVTAGVYSTLSLSRWEWSRALYFALVVVVAEVAFATALILRRLDRTGTGTGTADDDREGDRIRAVLRDHRSTPDRFAWLAPREVVSRSNVFITMLVGGGVLLSGLAWVLDKVASHTTTSIEEGRLAGDLTRIAYPEGGLLADEVEAMAQSVPHLEDPDLRILLGRPTSPGVRS